MPEVDLANVVSKPPASSRLKCARQRLEFYEANNIVEPAEKRAVVLTLCGEQTYETLRALVAPQKPSRVDLVHIINILTQPFNLRPSELLGRYRFQKRDQLLNESVKYYVTALPIMGKDCSIGNVDLTTAAREASSDSAKVRSHAARRRLPFGSDASRQTGRRYREEGGGTPESDRRSTPSVAPPCRTTTMTLATTSRPPPPRRPCPRRPPVAAKARRPRVEARAWASASACSAYWACARRARWPPLCCSTKAAPATGRTTQLRPPGGLATTAHGDATGGTATKGTPTDHLPTAPQRRAGEDAPQLDAYGRFVQEQDKPLEAAVMSKQRARRNTTRRHSRVRVASSALEKQSNRDRNSETHSKHKAVSHHFHRRQQASVPRSQVSGQASKKASGH
ncbi:hypothetical protein MRX96_054144 [Rhipicephalus microplus]